MLEQDQVARWVIGLAEGDQADERTMKFLESSLRASSCAFAHVRHELSGQGLNCDEIDSLALEVWEKTLRSVWRTWQQRPNRAGRIENLENYLMGAFHHRLNRYLKQKRSRESLLEFRSLEELLTMTGAANLNEGCAPQIHRGVQLKEVYAAMNQDMRLALMAKMYGFSWAAIAKRFQIDEQNLIMRVQYAIRKIRGKFTQT